MPEWEKPKVVKLEALPEVLGACVPGSTHVEGQSGHCRNGTRPSKHCQSGNTP